MKHRLQTLLVLLLTLLLALCGGVFAFAADGSAVPAEKLPLLVDDADLLTADEEATLLALLEKNSAAVQADIVIVTVEDTDGADVDDFAMDYYDYNGYGRGDDNDGVLLLISMAERDYWITTTGFCIEAITDYGLELIEDDFLSMLSGGDYPGAFRAYAKDCKTLISAARQGNIYDYYISDSDSENAYGGYYNDAYDYFGGEDYSAQSARSFNVLPNLVIALILGFVLALITASSMKRKLKSVHRKYEASNYVVPGTLHVRQSDDRFLYANVAKTPIPQHNENHSSGSGFSGGGSSTSIGSSGTSHGGGGGKF